MPTKKFSRLFFSFLAGILFFSFTIPSKSSFASERNTNNKNITQISEDTVSKEEIEEAQKVINTILELDKTLNMEDLSSNSQNEIEQLDKDTQEFYYLYKDINDQNNGEMKEEDILYVISSFMNNNYVQNQPQNGDVQPAFQRWIIKEYKISNQRIRDVLVLVGLHGTGWAFATALAKKFGKSPTWVAMMIVAVPALGAATLNACNRKGKGVIITRASYGTMHSFSCRSQ